MEPQARAREAGCVLLVGDRQGALRAAERLGWPVLLLTETAPKPSRRRRLLDWRVVDLAGPVQETARAGIELASGREVRAVVAVVERATLPAALVRSRLGLPGLDPETARRCRDKVAMKEAAAAAGIACAVPEVIVQQTTAAGLLERHGTPVVIKRRDAAGGLGTVFARDAAAVAAHLEPGLIAERFVDGVEMSVETLRFRGQTLLTNLTRYLVPGWASVLPERLPPALEAAVLACNQRVLDALGVEHAMTHLELFLTPGGIVFGEVAARPPGGYLMELLETAYGFCPWEALLRIEAGERPELPQSASRHAGAWILHPGRPGQLLAVEGLEQARAVPGVLDVQCRARPGDPVPARDSTARSLGRILCAAADPDACARALERARAAIRFRMEPDAADAGAPQN
ncbi:MAG: ATP-grasp domain-containing protein [Planctomycetota bacterium]|nr:MAG: ATP-grasp domain-containing protein [Planctomycetota bacterium]